MTVFVKDTANSVLSGLTKMKSGMIEDYNNFMPDNKSMCDEYAEKLTISYGKKYIKILSGGSAWGFINLANPKFKKGDILKAASWNAPALNAPRGNLFEDYVVQWTGPLYLR